MFAALILAAVVAACGGSDRGDSPEAGPSGGATAPPIERLAEWLEVVDTLWTIGTVEGAPEQEFGRITDAAFDGEGNVYLLDSASNLVRVFSADGAFLRSFGRSGRGPGEFAQPESMRHDGEETLYVLDGLNGLLRFRTTTPQGPSFEGALDIAAEGMSGTDFCFLGERIFVYGLSRDSDEARTHVVHELTREGERVRSFGELFGEPPGHPVRHALSGSGRIACSPASELLLVAPRRLSEVRAYGAADGGLSWSDSLPDFAEVWMDLDPPGAPAGAFSLGAAPGGGSDHNTAFHRMNGEGTVILAQSRRVAARPPSETIRSCLIDVKGRVCATRSLELPLILAISGSRAVTVEEELAPVVRLVEVSRARGGGG